MRGRETITAKQLDVLRRLETRSLWVGLNVNIATARSLLRRGLVESYGIGGEQSGGDPSWGIKLTVAGRELLERSRANG